MGFYKRNRSLFLIMLGAGLMAVSLCWEYVRMKPDYRYLVEPWSIRGYETTQGWVLFAAAVAVIVLAVPLSLRLLKGKFVESLLVAGAVATVATLLPVVAGAPDQRLGGVQVWGLAVLLGLAVVAVVARLLPEELAGSRRRAILFGVFAAITALAGLLVYAQLFGDRSVPLWVVVLLLMVTLDVLVIARPPYELAPYRLLLIAVLLVWVVALVCAGSLRSTLLRLQLENQGIAAEYRDIQITSGILVAWAGGLLAFAGVVALWAHRRDELEEYSRAGRQLAVAELSATELEQAV
ncbi:MAG: hypothetical protein ABIJ48_05305 [Actinomycetota bacterium]